MKWVGWSTALPPFIISVCYHGSREHGYVQLTPNEPSACGRTAKDPGRVGTHTGDSAGQHKTKKSNPNCLKSTSLTFNLLCKIWSMLCSSSCELPTYHGVVSTFVRGPERFRDSCSVTGKKNLRNKHPHPNPIPLMS